MVTRVGLLPGQCPEESASGQAAAIDYTVPASTRALDMLLNKVKGLPYQSEVAMPGREECRLPMLETDIRTARIALVTDGGLVPKGNPDCMPPTNSNKFCIYSISGKKRLQPGDYDISHQGYNNAYIQEDPNRLMPIDVLREAEKDGVIGKLWELFYTTTGVMTSVENGTAMGKEIAASLKSSEVDAVILTSTCGTSTRCGSLIAREIEKENIPVVQVTNLTKIAEGIGIKRIMKGNNICHVFGKPELTPPEERQFRKDMLNKVLKLLEIRPECGNSIVWSM
ncbi:MAG: glycine/betaine/sarcosine/D-proline family reductase selenoprotein B [Deltaproteobacteria bacterium]|jgi:glycine reductase|nr:glycine/betaine/sarcosine/D-proline family reductase selenoprotein B [Deltaproteobacteria bacterium]